MKCSCGGDKPDKQAQLQKTLDEYVRLMRELQPDGLRQLGELARDLAAKEDEWPDVIDA